MRAHPSAPSNPNIIYAGTGEEDSRDPISPGGGVYKSADADRTWKLKSLEADGEPIDP